MDESSLKIVLYNFATAFTASVFTEFPINSTVILGILMTLDFIAGIAKAICLDESVTSKKMKIGVIGKTLTLLIPLCVALAGVGAGLDLSKLVAFTLNLLILSELYSFISNLLVIKTKKALPEFDAISLIANKIKSLLEGIVK